MFKAIELDAARRRTGREFSLDAQTRQAAIDRLLELLDIPPDRALVDPSRTLVRIGDHLWTLVAGARKGTDAVTPSLRRAGAKHKHVR